MPEILTVIIALTTGLVLLLYLMFRQYKSSFLATKTSETIKNKIILKIAVPRNNDKSPFAAEQLYSSLHGIGLNKNISPEHFSLEIAAGPYGIHFICVVSKEYRTFVENQFYSQYPEAQISVIKDYTETFANNKGVVSIEELTLSKEPYLPLRTFQSFDVDPLAGITGSVSSLPPGHEVFIQILARPLADTWQETGRAHVKELKGKTDEEGNKTSLESGDSEIIRLIENKNTKVGFQFLIRILAVSPDKITSERLLAEVVAAFGQYRTAIFNSLAKPKVVKKEGFEKIWSNFTTSIRKAFVGQKLSEKLSKKDKFINRFLNENTKAVINTEELASLYHIPNKSVETPNISWARSKKLEYPLNIPTGKDARVVGLTDYRGVHVPFGLRALDRLRHMYVIGKTGVGKSTFMEGLIMADIYDGNGVGVIDPHGELVEEILRMIPPNRIEDVVLFDPGDTEYPVGFNMLELQGNEDISLITDGIVSVFKKQWGDSWGPRLEYILTNTLLTLLTCQNVSLLVIPRMLSDDNYRTFILKQLKDPILLKFWNEEYAQMAADKRRLAQEISSILNKIGRFTTNPMIRNIVGQVSSSINIRQIMDEKKILLVNLSQGKVGEENMALVGGMLVSRIYSSATQRLDPKERVPFYLFIDEFQNFSTPTFVKILSEARKYGLSLTMAHQFIDQVEENIRNAIFGNVGSMINFAVGPKDSEVLIREYAPHLEPTDLVNLGRGKIVTKISIDMAQSKPFTAQTLLPNFPETNNREEVVAASRRKYAKHRDVIRKKLYKWADQVYSKQGNIVPREILKKYADQKEQEEKENRKNRNSNYKPAGKDDKRSSGSRAPSSSSQGRDSNSRPPSNRSNDNNRNRDDRRPAASPIQQPAINKTPNRTDSPSRPQQGRDGNNNNSRPQSSRPSDDNRNREERPARRESQPSKQPANQNPTQKENRLPRKRNTSGARLTQAPRVNNNPSQVKERVQNNPQAPRPQGQKPRDERPSSTNKTPVDPLPQAKDAPKVQQRKDNTNGPSWMPKDPLPAADPGN